MTCNHNVLKPAGDQYPTGTAECRTCGAILSPDEAFRSMKGEEVCPENAGRGAE